MNTPLLCILPSHPPCHYRRRRTPPTPVALTNHVPTTESDPHRTNVQFATHSIRFITLHPSWMSPSSFPSLNQSEYTRDAPLQPARRRHTYAQITVIDNASTDQTAILLADRPAIEPGRDPQRHQPGMRRRLEPGRPRHQGRLDRRAQQRRLGTPTAGWKDCRLRRGKTLRYRQPSPLQWRKRLRSRKLRRPVHEEMARVKRRGTATGVCFMVHRRVFEAQASSTTTRASAAMKTMSSSAVPARPASAWP